MMLQKVPKENAVFRLPLEGFSRTFWTSTAVLATGKMGATGEAILPVRHLHSLRFRIHSDQTLLLA
jgi:hypothetical protein